MAYFAIKGDSPRNLRTTLESLILSDPGADRWIALADTAFDDPRQAFRIAGKSPVPLYQLGRLEALKSVSPVLIELATHEPVLLREQLMRLANHCHAKPMLSLIQTPSTPDELCEAWQALLEIETDDQDRFLLRFADTRVLPAIAGIDPIWSRLAADISAWWIMGRDGKLQLLQPPISPLRSAETLKLGLIAYTELVNAGSADAIIEYLNEHFPNLLSGRDGYANYLLVGRVLNLCNRFDIGGASEQHALVIATMMTDDQLLETAGFTTWLAEKAWPPGRLEDALADWMDAKEIAC